MTFLIPPLPHFVLVVVDLTLVVSLEATSIQGRFNTGYLTSVFIGSQVNSDNKRTLTDKWHFDM